MRSLYLVIPFVFLLSSCRFSVNINDTASNDIDLGEMPVVKAETFENIQVIDENYCRKYDYPLTRFAIEYPDSVEIQLHEDKYSYINFKVRKEGEIIEELAIGSTTLTIPTKSKSMELFELLIPQFEQQIESLTIDFIGRSNFKDKLEYQINGYADYTPYIDLGYNGKYILIMMIPFPEKNEKLKAVIVSFVANEKSDIRSYKDFEDKGVISKIWNTFRYVE